MIPRPRTLVTATVLALALAAPGRGVPQARHARRQPDREPALAAVSHPLLRDRRRASPASSAQQFQAAVTRAFGTWHAVENTRDLIDVRRVRAGAAVRGGRRERHRLPQSARAGSHARRDDLHRRRDRRPHPRVGHLLQYHLSLVDRRGRRHRSLSTSSRSRCTRSGTCSGCRTRRSARPSCIGGGRRVIAAEAVMFPIAFTPRQHRRPLAQGRRHRRHLRHLRHDDVHRDSSAASAGA